MISVIIPLLNNEPGLRRTLTALVPEKAGQEILVVDGGSVDGGLEEARSRPWVRVVRAEGGRATLNNVGAAKAKGDVLLFLPPGVALERGWPAVVEAAAAQSAFGIGCFRLSVSGRNPLLRFVTLESRLRTFWFDAARGTQALFVRAADVKDQAVFPDTAGVEDFELCKQRTAGGKLVRLPLVAINPSARWERFGIWDCLKRDVQGFWQWRQGEGAENLAARYGDDRNAVVMFWSPSTTAKVVAWLDETLGAGRGEPGLRQVAGHVLDTVHRTPVPLDSFVYFRPKAAREEIRRWVGDVAMLIPQRGRKTSERRANAVASTLRMGYDKVLVLGPHCPTISEQLLTDALAALDSNDLVLGPTDDGECYLLGMKQAHGDLLGSLDWTGGGLLAECTTAAAEGGLSYTTLPALRDLDSDDDLGHAWALGMLQV